MKNRLSLSALAVSLPFALASAAHAGGDSGTQSMGEMTLTGAQFGMLVGAVCVLGLVIWAVVKFINK